MYKGLKAGVPWNQNQVIELGVAPTLQGLINQGIQKCVSKFPVRIDYVNTLINKMGQLNGEAVDC